ARARKLRIEIGLQAARPRRGPLIPRRHPGRCRRATRVLILDAHVLLRPRPCAPAFARRSLHATRQIPRHAAQARTVNAQAAVEIRERGRVALALLFSPHGSAVSFVGPRIILRIAPC
ncbi:MAG: hypothetical protein ABTQ28_08230, partial [Thauera sp.]